MLGMVLKYPPGKAIAAIPHAHHRQPPHASSTHTEGLFRLAEVIAIKKAIWPVTPAINMTAAEPNAGLLHKPTAATQSAPTAICIKPYMPAAAPVTAGSILIA
jgi:hypothetical protein